MFTVTVCECITFFDYGFCSNLNEGERVFINSLQVGEACKKTNRSSCRLHVSMIMATDLNIK